MPEAIHVHACIRAALRRVYNAQTTVAFITACRGATRHNAFAFGPVVRSNGRIRDGYFPPNRRTESNRPTNVHSRFVRARPDAADHVPSVSQTPFNVRRPIRLTAQLYATLGTSIKNETATAVFKHLSRPSIGCDFDDFHTVFGEYHAYHAPRRRKFADMTFPGTLPHSSH